MITPAQVVEETLTWLGTPYHHQAALKGVGCDCLGLVRGVYAALVGVEPEKPPPYSPDWAESSPGREEMLAAARRHLVERPWKRGEPLLPGDVVVFRYRQTSAAKHAAIIVADGWMVHSYNRVGVTRVSVGPFWTARVAGVFVFSEG